MATVTIPSVHMIGSQITAHELRIAAAIESAQITRRLRRKGHPITWYTMEGILG